MAYEVNLKEFQGPLDLLLHLIEQAEVDIKDIFISEITAQYLEYMGQIDTLDMDTASEFITMAVASAEAPEGKHRGRGSRRCPHTPAA